LIETLPGLPTLPSGKVDRKSLPRPGAAPAAAARQLVLPGTETERELAAAWAPLFAPVPVSATDDFFLDLGGHSLLAARLVSDLRRTQRFARISMLDVYQHPTIRSLAARFEKDSTEPARRNGPLSDQSIPPNAESRNRTRLAEPSCSPLQGEKAEVAGDSIPFWRHFFCGVAQAISLVFILSFFALQWLAPYITYTILIEEEFDFLPAILGAFASLIAFYPIMLAIPIAVKWLVIGRYRPGAYPLWGTYFFRWWLVTTIEAAVPVAYLAGTPLLNIYLRLMGARVGPGVHLASDNFAIYDLLSIGEGACINVDTNLLGYTVEHGFLKIGSINIGRDCFVGARAALRENTVMQDRAALEDLSLLPRGGVIPAGETWAGSPAQRSAEAPSAHSSDKAGLKRAPESSAVRRFGFGVLHGIGLLIFPVLVVAALFPGIVVMNKLNYLDPYYWYLFLSPLVGASFVGILALEIAGLKWLLLGRIQPGRLRLHSFAYLRKWFVDQTLDLSLDILGPLYASVYLAPWYKLLGARLGPGAEVSTASFISPDLLEIGEESFIADNVSLGAPRIEAGEVMLGHNKVGKRSFIGNSAALPPGTAVGDDILIGCLSTPPANPVDALREDSAWLGSPAIFLPQRQKSAGFGIETTFRPSAKLRAQRAAIEFLRVISPATGFIVLLSLMFSLLLLLHDSYSLAQTLLFFPPLYVGCGFVAVLVTVAAKWLLVGRYRPGEKPLWSTFVWRNELLNALHEHLAEPFLVGALTGTPFICWYFRLLGTRIGRRVYMETTDFSEFDLAEIGDEAALNSDCTIQTHLFEDRVMKMSGIRVGAHCHVGAGSLVLYDTCMEAGSSLDDLSLLMKGETLPANTHWQGSPARACLS
jgi:non-ribosomal peptide synthetase-like protein